jgi:hypothetical protein
VPQPSWHGYVAEMRACRADLARTHEVAAEMPEVLDLFARALDGELEEAFDAPAAPPALAVAYQRLGRLPIPAGEHPYLDEIVPTLEALEALLVAISLVPAAADVFHRGATSDWRTIKQRSMMEIVEIEYRRS